MESSLLFLAFLIHGVICIKVGIWLNERKQKQKTAKVDLANRIYYE